jgi:ATP-dependent Lhr-like helicase
VLLPGEPSTDIEDPDTLDPPPLHVGEVDEAFADRLEPGDRFLLDGRCLEFRAREPEGLRVEEVAGRPRVPRWGGDGWPLSPELARRLYCLRVQAAEALRDGPDALAGLLACDYGVEGSANRELVDYFERQESASEIPDAATLLIEAVGCQGLGATEYFLHTPLNRRGNDALARVAVLRLVRDLGRGAASAVADLGFCLRLRGELPEPPEVVRRLLHPEGFDADLDSALAESPALRERFQRVALTGLMLLRNPEGRRRKVGGRGWGGRELFEQVRGHDPDFVLLRQAMREVRTELCDASAGLAFARDLPRLSVRCRRLPRRSPFVEAWTQLGAGPTEAAESPAEALRRLHASLMGASDARPG